jgi:hypothetical protein
MPFTLRHPAYGGFETRFRKGHSLRVGMKHTEEFIKKMRESRKGIDCHKEKDTYLKGGNR